MSQVSAFTTQDGTGLAVRTAINAITAALSTCSSGPSAPSAPVQGQLWFNTTFTPRVLMQWDDSINAGAGGWVQLTAGPTQVLPAAIPAGAINNLSLGPLFGFLEVTAAGAANITGIAAGFDGQELILTNVGVPQVTINALNAGSAAANRIRLPADFVLNQNNSIFLKYSLSLALWVGVP